MRIDKTINKDVYSFYAYFIPNERKAKVRYFGTDEFTVCDISEDWKYIILPKNQFVFNGKAVEKLKLTKANQWEAKDYNGINK